MEDFFVSLQQCAATTQHNHHEECVHVNQHLSPLGSTFAGHCCCGLWLATFILSHRNSVQSLCFSLLEEKQTVATIRATVMQ